MNMWFGCGNREKDRHFFWSERYEKDEFEECYRGNGFENGL